MIKTSLLVDYEKVMVNDKYKNYKVVQQYEEAQEGVKNAAYIIRYVFESILEWSPSMIRDYFTPQISKWLNLENCIDKIPFPSELDKSRDYFYIASFLYPKELPYKKKHIVLDLYEKERCKKKPKFNRGFFKHANGKENFNICMRYIVSEKFINASKEDIYSFFSENKPSRAFLRENNLLDAMSVHYSTPLEAVHNVLPDVDKDDTLYYYYMITSELKRKKVRCCPRIIKEKMEVAE